MVRPDVSLNVPSKLTLRKHIWRTTFPWHGHRSHHILGKMMQKQIDYGIISVSIMALWHLAILMSRKWGFRLLSASHGTSRKACTYWMVSMRCTVWYVNLEVSFWILRWWTKQECRKLSGWRSWSLSGASTKANQHGIYIIALTPCGRMCYAMLMILLVTRASSQVDARAQASSVNVEIGVSSKPGLKRIRPVGDIPILMITTLIH